MEENWAIDPGPIDIPDELRERIKPDLAQGERLLWASWSGRMSSTVRASSPAVPLVWTVGLGALAVSCLFAASFSEVRRHEELGALLVILGLGSAIVGFVVFLVMIAGYSSRRAIRRALAGRAYALTDRRAIIWMPVPKTGAFSVHTFPRGTIAGDVLHRVEYPDGSGDLFFRHAYHQPPGFLGIAEVRRVEELVRQALVVPGPSVRHLIENLLAEEELS